MKKPRWINIGCIVSEGIRHPYPVVIPLIQFKDDDSRVAHRFWLEQKNRNSKEKMTRRPPF